MRFLPLLLVLLMMLPAYAFAQSFDCSLMHQGRFSYMADEEKVIVTIRDSILTEHHKKGNVISSKIQWVNDCEYNITILKITVPKFPLTVGDEVNVKIERVEGAEIFYTITVKSVSWQGVFTKLE